MNNNQYSGLQICHAKTEDLSVILQIYDCARQYMRANGNFHQWINGYPSAELLRSDIDKKQLYVIRNKKNICGVFAFIIGMDPTYAYIENGCWLSDSTYGTIHRIASDRSQRGILQQAVSFCEQQIRHLRIDTHKDNIPMQQAVLRNGFTECGTIYLEDGSPRIAYEKISSIT